MKKKDFKKSKIARLKTLKPSKRKRRAYFESQNMKLNYPKKAKEISVPEINQEVIG